MTVTQDRVRVELFGEVGGATFAGGPTGRRPLVKMGPKLRAEEGGGGPSSRRSENQTK